MVFAIADNREPGQVVWPGFFRTFGKLANCEKPLGGGFTRAVPEAARGRFVDGESDGSFEIQPLGLG